MVLWSKVALCVAFAGSMTVGSVYGYYYINPHIAGGKEKLKVHAMAWNVGAAEKERRRPTYTGPTMAGNAAARAAAAAGGGGAAAAGGAAH